jgi:hypothetical protein
MPVSQPARPWHRYRKEKQWRLLEPGFAGELTEPELQYILLRLQTDPALAYWWGFRATTKRRPEGAIRSVALWGSPDVRAVNVRLARKPRIPDAA